MARIRPIPVSLFLVMLLGVLAMSAPAAEQSPWLEIHSTHFTVITDAGEKKGKEVALRFEQMRAVFAILLMKDRLNEPLPLTIIAFKNDKDYYQSAPLRQGQPIKVPGFFVPGEDQNFIVLNLFEEESWRAVAHDFAHLLLNYNYPPVEGWFDEGLAEYFGSIRVDNKQVEIGGDPELTNLYTEDLLENQIEARNPPKSLTELLGGQVWLALPDLLTLKHDTSTYLEATHHTLFYAQSWMTIHYLLHEKKLPETGTYFDLVENQHVPVEEAVQKAYGVSPAQFDQAVKTYFHSLTPLFVALDASKLPNASANPPQVYNFPAPVGPNDNAIIAQPMRETDARAFVAAVKTRIPDRREAGLRELQALASAPEPGTSSKAENKKAGKNDDEAPLVAATGNEIAHRALAWDHLQHGEFDAAAEELGDAAALNQRDMWIRYYLAVLKYRIAKAHHADILGLPNMMQDLRAVLDWYPEFADAYDLMAMARKVGGGPVAAMQAERAAMQLSPRNQEYVYHLAEIYIEAKNWEAARAMLERLKASNNPQVAAEAREQLTRLANEQKYGLSTASTAPKFSPQSSPFDVLEQDAAKRAAAAQASQTPGVGDRRAAKFFQGRLLAVDCSQSPAAVLTVVAGGTVLKLRTADYKSLLLIGADSFSCAWNDRSVSVNYKPGGVSDGDLVSVELR
ncbi:MAG TPA: tetratricopeptide repeat protein [Candidatus Sulfotelmatobacter sp.]|jgi:tetratricopeptide (TPR) repeat protein|nr:tetratricopeptide repeat protein [Candidatus Sulfotelmatobacter sp.]